MNNQNKPLVDASTGKAPAFDMSKLVRRKPSIPTAPPFLFDGWERVMRHAARFASEDPAMTQHETDEIMLRRGSWFTLVIYFEIAFNSWAVEWHTADPRLFNFGYAFGAAECCQAGDVVESFGEYEHKLTALRENSGKREDAVLNLDVSERVTSWHELARKAERRVLVFLSRLQTQSESRCASWWLDDTSRASLARHALGFNDIYNRISKYPNAVVNALSDRWRKPHDIAKDRRFRDDSDSEWW
jgi:hypothetical protein